MVPRAAHRRTLSVETTLTSFNNGGGTPAAAAAPGALSASPSFFAPSPSSNALGVPSFPSLFAVYLTSLSCSSTV